MSGDDLPIIPVGMRNAPFALDMWARDCPPTQFIREFTVNGIEAIEAYRDTVDPSFCGEVTWTFDPLYDAAGQTKLACIDTGIGMSAVDMPLYLNDLTSSGKAQRLDRNYGIGAKVSAAVGNPHGVVYVSWQDGQGHLAELGRDESGTWGMRQHRRRDGTVTAVLPVDPSLRAEQLGDSLHGTVVTFLGKSAQDDTTLPPPGERAERWIVKALNQRFYELPDWVTVRVRERHVAGQETSQRFRTVRGQRYFLDRHTEAAGIKEIPGAKVHWRILSDNHADRTKQSDTWASTGHRACLFQGELFELATSARGGYQKLMEFGIRFGYERVVLYVEPEVDGRTVTQDTVRTHVKIDGEPLPWASYAAAFEADMPQELAAFQERIAAAAHGRDHSATIRDRLNDIAELYQVPRYRPMEDGPTNAEAPTHGGQPGDEKGRPHRKPGSRRSSGGTGGSVYSLFERDDAPPATRVDATQLPDISVSWVSVEDGTRARPHLEDRAGRYDRRRNELEINADFRGYRDIVNRWRKRYSTVPAAPVVIEELAGSWWQQALEETVLGVLALRGSQYWDDRAVESALSETALTGAAMQRYHLDTALKRELAQKLGSVRRAA